MIGDWAAIVAPRLTTMRRTPLRATFIERPHRFAARCRLRGGCEAVAHLPNPGRLTGVLAPGCQILLDGPYPETRTLTYTMVAAKADGVWVGTNTLYANRIFPALVSHGLFPEFEDRTSSMTCATRLDDAARTGRGTAGSIIRSEVVHGRSRFDFDVGGMMVEVKSVTLVGTGFTTCVGRPNCAARTGCDTASRAAAGLFPDAVSARAARHCDELAALAAAGRPAAIVFVAQRGDVESVAPEDEIDPVFGGALRCAANAGVLVLACALDVTPHGAMRARRVPVLLGDA